MRRPLAAALIGLALAGCERAPQRDARQEPAQPPAQQSAQAPAQEPAQEPGRAPTPGAAFGADSIVLERTACKGTCPVYTVAITRTGAVRFTGSAGGDSTRRETDSVAPAAFAALIAQAGRAGFAALPPTIRADTTYCPQAATDFPSAVLSIYGRSAMRVEDYLGCATRERVLNPPQLVLLRALEHAVDSVTGARRWIPARGGKSPD